MKIKTKYSIGDKVWYILNNKVESSTISGIQYEIRGKFLSVKMFYEIGNRTETFGESRLFESKEELLKTL